MQAQAISRPLRAAGGDQRVVRGETLTLLLVVRDADGELVDLTGATAYLTVRPWVDGYPMTKADPVIALSSGGAGGITLADQAGDTLGQMTAVVTAAQTAALITTAYVWDAWLVTGAGARHAIVPPARLAVTDRVTTSFP